MKPKPTAAQIIAEGIATALVIVAVALAVGWICKTISERSDAAEGQRGSLPGRVMATIYFKGPVAGAEACEGGLHDS